MTSGIFRAHALDTPRDPFSEGPGALRSDSDVAIVVNEGVIVARSPIGDACAAYPDFEVVDLRSGLLLPGMVDTHAHYPQVRIIGGLGMPLLRWLEECALPEEARLADVEYATEVATDFLTGLTAAGTTTALVFGSHFASALDVFFDAAAASGLRITAGQVVSDGNLRAELHIDPDTAVSEGSGLIERWHGGGEGRLRYAVTPRFALSASAHMLEACAALASSAEGVMVTSHVNENLREVAAVAQAHPHAQDYVDTYARAGLLGRHTVLAHNVHPTEAELAALGGSGTAVAHCPTSNAALGSGLFPLRRHLEHDVRIGLGSDVGAGTGFSLFKEGLQAYFGQQLLGDQGYQLTPAHLLHLATSAGAQALGLGEQVGDLSVGKQFDAVLVQPAAGSTFDVALRHAPDEASALARVFVHATPSDVRGVWVAGRPVLSNAASR